MKRRRFRRRTRGWVQRLALLATLVFSILWLGGCGKRVPKGPNVVLICIDTLRPDHLGCYGYERNTSPTLDSLASSGVLFLNAQAQSSWTLPSHVTLLSSTFPFTHGVVDDNSRIPEDLPMMAEILSEHGYSTAGVVSSFYVGRTYGYERGFDFFDDFSSDRYQQVFPGSKVLAQNVVDRGLEWLGRNEEPFFLFLHFYDAHINYIVPEPYRTRFEKQYTGPEIIYHSYGHYLKNPLTVPQRRHIRAQYDAAIAYVDAQIARVLAAIREMRVSDHTLLWITSDHGEEFFERGSWGHAHTLYREVLDVPLIIVDPRQGVSGRQVSQPVRLIDTLPTLLEAIGLPPVEGIQGRSFWPFVSEAGPTDWKPLLFSETSRYNLNLVSLGQRPLTFIADLGDNHQELYDLETDPGEEHNLASQDTAAVRALLDETFLISSELIPGRLMIRWRPEADPCLYTAQLRTPGTFVEVDYRGSEKDGLNLSRDRHHLTVSADQAGELHLAVVPVDALVVLDLKIDGRPPSGRVFVGGSSFQPEEMPLIFPGVVRSREFFEEPPQQGPGFYIWKDPGDRLAAEPVDLSDEAKEHLRSLGYLH